MPPADILTPRLILKPFRSSFARGLEDVVFADMEVVKGLEHNTCEARERRAFADAWTETLCVEGDCPAWRLGGPGSYGLFLRRAGEVGDGGLIGIVGVYDLAITDGVWQGEFFYALGSRWHRQGLMSEAVAATLARYRSLAEPTRLWAVHWRILNQPSGRILRRSGFVERGVRRATEVFGRSRVATLPAFELARLAAAPETDRDRVLWEAAVKLGHLAAEGVVEREDISRALARGLPDADRSGPREADIEAALELGMGSPALSYLTWAAQGRSDPS